jgi:predicted DNA-binding protein (MmcQ/YjbR family)
MARNNLKKTAAALRTKALRYPQTIEAFPWEHSAFKVKGKVFLFTFLDENEGVLSMSMKLPVSNRMALTLPFAQPTGYGLGKSGWVTSTFKVGDDIPLDMLLEWTDESFRAVAPKRVLAQMEGAEQKPTTKPQRHKKKGEAPTKVRRTKRRA